MDTPTLVQIDVTCCTPGPLQPKLKGGPGYEASILSRSWIKGRGQGSRLEIGGQKSLPVCEWLFSTKGLRRRGNATPVVTVQISKHSPSLHMPIPPVERVLKNITSRCYTVARCIILVVAQQVLDNCMSRTAKDLSSAKQLP